MIDLSFNDRWRVYELAVYMAWGDERLAPDEISAARAIAAELALDSDLLASGSVLRRGPPVLSDLGLDYMSTWARLVAYASAAWVAYADGEEHPAERAILRTLAYRLDLDGEAAFLLEASALLVSAHGGTVAARSQYRALLHAVADVHSGSTQLGEILSSDYDRSA